MGWPDHTATVDQGAHMFATILSLADGIVHLLGVKLDRKYLEEYNDLKLRIREEEAKPRDKQSDAVLDNLRNKLCLVAGTIAAEARK